LSIFSFATVFEVVCVCVETAIGGFCVGTADDALGVGTVVDEVTSMIEVDDGWVGKSKI